jgi:uncharacterized membrane protein/mono/diheme cytochrome c family protein
MTRRAALWNAVATLAAVLLVFLFVDPTGRTPDWGRFLARQHPALVHLPIGFLLFGFVLALFRRWQKEDRPSTTEQVALVLGGWGAVAAAAAGSWLIQMGAFPADLLLWHRWLGFFIPLAAAATLWLGVAEAARPARTLSWTLLVGSLFVGGHLGGEMTHGEGYVGQYAPGFLKPILGERPVLTARFDLSTPDSTTIYDGLVAPIFAARCTSCHGEGRSKGGLDLTTPEAIAAHETDSEDDPLITWGDPATSLLIQRIVLPEGHRRIMPPAPDAHPLSHSDVELIKWWVASEAGFDGTIAGTDMPPSIKTLLTLHGMGEIKEGVYAIDLPMPDTTLFASVRAAGGRITPVAADLPYLELACSSASCLDAAAGLEDHIIAVDLSGSDATDAAVARLSGFAHLTSLDLSRTTINGSSLGDLSSLAFLSRLNLYGTALDDAGLDRLAGLPALESAYVWQTNVTEEGVARLRDALPNAEINDGR